MASAELHKLVTMLRTSKIAIDPTIEEIRAGWEKFTASFVPAADLSFKPVVARGVAAEWVTAPESDPSRVVPELRIRSRWGPATRVAPAEQRPALGSCSRTYRRHCPDESEPSPS